METDGAESAGGPVGGGGHEEGRGAARLAPGAGPDQADPSQVLPPAAYAAALASVPGIGPKALRTLLDGGTPESAWDDLVRGRARQGIARWAAAAGAAREMDVSAVWSAHVGAGVRVTVRGQPGYPTALADDPEAPAVLFSLGDPCIADDRPRVAMVGTRSATRYGLGVAAQLGADLAAVGVVVISGLALGIDGAAHEGALAAWRAVAGPQGGSRSTEPARAEAPEGALAQQVAGAAARAAAPVAVVAGSVDTPYPRQHAGLWRRVAEAGAVISEAPLSSADLGWRFPQRNRIMAAMADVVVVVECHPSGGSMHTVQAAARRGVPVGAVPGSVRSPASAGANALLADGCFVVRDASDVLVAVGLATASALPLAVPASAEPGGVASRLSEASPPRGSGSESVLEALGWERCSVEQLLRRTGLGLDQLSVALERLRAEGVVDGSGGTWERTGSGPRTRGRP